jgi:hypothetical protein
MASGAEPESVIVELKGEFVPNAPASRVRMVREVVAGPRVSPDLSQVSYQANCPEPSGDGLVVKSLSEGTSRQVVQGSIGEGQLVTRRAFHRVRAHRE